ncbi:S24 family peptidase [Campylobacter lari]|nr:S24 family peptidase [Campylobacter lari]
MKDYYELVEELKTFFNVKSLEEVAEKLGYKKNNANNWRNNKQLSAQALKKYYDLKNNKKHIIKTSNIENIIKIRYFPNVYASAGFGNGNSDENFQTIYLDKNFLVEILGIPYKTQYDMIKIFGDSMEPFIQNGSFVIVDTSKNSLDKIKNADVAIFRYDGELFCKRIRKNVLDDEIIISSDNIGFEDKKIKKSALKDYVFLGVVICSCNTKIFLNQIERV